MSLFCKENDIPYPKYKILEEDLKSTEAQKQEKYWVDFYKDNGWKMFNITKTGSLGGATIIWTKKALQDFANKCETREDFRKNSGAAWAVKNKKTIDELFKNHPNNGFKEDFWTIKKLQEEANKYETIKDFRKNSLLAYRSAWGKKVLNQLFKNHINNGHIINPPNYWTIEKLQEEANKYKTRMEFRKSENTAYSIASSKGLIDELFKNHLNKGFPKK